jgi:hypothetical protein
MVYDEVWHVGATLTVQPVDHTWCGPGLEIERLNGGLVFVESGELSDLIMALTEAQASLARARQPGEECTPDCPLSGDCPALRIPEGLIPVCPRRVEVDLPPF